jgi:hypothetical protein
MTGKGRKGRNILALSGGKDSAALAVYLKGKIPDLEYVFMDTGHELPETYEYLQRMRAILGIQITVIRPKRDFDFWLTIFRGCLPSPQNRWCTRELKILPYEEYIGKDQAISYIALRADEDRTGYIAHKANIIPMYPFIEDGLMKSDIISLLNDKGLGLPGYYEWRSRSGCYFCFFQRRAEWVALHDRHPELFKNSCQYENAHSDGRKYTWIQGTSLEELVSNCGDELRKSSSKSEQKTVRNMNTLGQRLSALDFDLSLKINIDQSVEDSSEESKPCLICTL